MFGIFADQISIPVSAMQVAQALQQMEAYIAKFPNDLLEGLRIGQAAIAGFHTAPVNKVIITGLGGSGIGGRILENAVSQSCKVPILFLQDYTLPAWVDHDTLLIAVSYSGNTEETLSALAEAEARKPQVVCITAGGEMERVARENHYNIIVIPSGQPPRTSLGWNSVQQFFALHAYGLIDDRFKSDFTAAADLLHREKGAIVTQAEEVALALRNTIPIIYCEAGIEAVAVRLRQQINENGKMLCWHHVLPEMNHNELVGWAGAKNGHSVLFLKTSFDNPRTSNRVELTRSLVKTHTEIIVDLIAKGQSRIEQIYYLIHLGDWISYALAELEGIDPIDIAVIDRFKSALAKS